MEALYDKEVTCPICKKNFQTKKVRTSALRIEKKDTDFCIHYTGDNPIFYSVFICPMCGYGAMENDFQNISSAGKKIIESKITNRWVQRSFGKERTIEEAIEAYKIALVCAQFLGLKKGILGSLCLRIAWLYRQMANAREEDFLKHTLDCFEEAFITENLPIGGLDEASMQYLLGELNRRVGNYEKAIEWFSKAVGNPQIKGKKKIEELARDQWRLAKEGHRNLQIEEQVG